MDKRKRKQLNSSIFGILGAGLVMPMLFSTLGGMKKMFEFEDVKNRNLAKQMMSGAVEGILDHFEWKLDEQKRQIADLKEEIGKLKEERDSYKEKLDKKESKK